MPNYELIDAQTLETVFNDLTREEAQELIDRYPNQYLLHNAEYDSLTA